MSKWPRRTGALFFLGAVLATACSGGSTDPSAANRGTPTTSLTKKPGLCQPFPDRLIDEFVADYNGRDLEGLRSLVTAPDVRDVVAAAYTGDSHFEDVEEWAKAGWDAGDRMRLVGYGAFHGSKSGFQMMLTRTSNRLRAAGIERVSTALNADSEGCAITLLESAGPVQAESDPCAFYDFFATVRDVSSTEPHACAEGSARFARMGPVGVFTGKEMLVWGGHRGGQFTFADMAMDGLSFEPGASEWGRIPPLEVPAFSPEIGTWTGTELIVIGSQVRPDYRIRAAAYNPEARTWRTIEFPFKRASGFEGVWTGEELLLWGGPSHSEHPSRRGLVYNPVTDAWRKTSPAPGSGRWSHAVVWTGTELIVFGGGNANVELADGFAYNPSTDTWRELPLAPLTSRQWLPLVWTGHEVIVWGGSSISRSVADGAAYDPATDSWRKLPRSPLRGRHYHSAVWTGSEMIVFGGYNYHRSFSDGAAYDPVADEWRKLARAPVKRRFEHAAVWTGSEMIVFGGTWDFGHIALGDGAVYKPTVDRWQRVVPD